jgi:anthranilate phosphoribosyltransferase
MTAATAMELRKILGVIATGATLDEAQAEAAFRAIMRGDATATQIGGLLLAMRTRGETVAEITGAVRAMRAHMVSVAARADAIDCCGTGGDAAETVNVSTAVAFVVAGCGVLVAKHGNRAVSSRTGAADVLEALGVNLHAPVEPFPPSEEDGQVLFLFAPRHHSATRHVGPSRVELGTRTIFNLLGPLSNPAGAKRQLLGVFSPQWLEPLAEVLRALGSERAWVVHGGDGLDELTTTTVSSVAELRDGVIHRFEIAPEDAGVARAHPEDLRGGDAQENAAALQAMLDGQRGPYRDIVILNAAAALIVAGRTDRLAEGAALARRSIDSGAALARLAALVRITNAVPA